ncbi:uncharacterized protein LOC131224332 [Magnolia sinica]|uniref:uncharacterized protein LOC131224332 n=1 Tax=Magnolia sinica TaxID=86752 RepID=UPI00265A0D09|nr:uncharacterized protein LOC131224332 [Magnolia sinica]
MIACLQKVKKLINKFNKCEVTLVQLVVKVDDDITKSIPIKFLPKPSIGRSEPEGVILVSSALSWMNPIIGYLQQNKLPDDKLEAWRIRNRAARYTMIGDVLYKRGFSLSYLRCLRLDEAKYVLREIYERVYGNHLSWRALAHKVNREGYY